MKQTNLRNYGQLFLASLTLALSVHAGVAQALPRFGSECIACHETSTGPAPATSTAIAPTPVPEVRVPPLWETTEDAVTNENTQIPPKPSPQAPQTQVAQPASTPTTPAETSPVAATPLQQPGHTGRNAHRDPLSFGLTVGFLSSTDIEQHRSNSIFHGSTEASFFQPGAEGGGENEDTDPEAGNRLHLGALANYQVGLGNRSSLTFGARVFRDDFIDEDFHRLNARLSIGWRQRYDGQMLRLTTYFQQTTFDGDADDLNDDFVALGFKADYNRDLASGATLVGALHVRQRDYDGEDDPRKGEFSSALGLRHIGPDLSSEEYGVAFVTRNNARRERNRYDSPSVYASMTRPITPTTTLGLFGELGIRSYKADDPTEGEARSDSFGELGFSLQDSRLNIMSASPRFSCAYNQTVSNIERFDSDATYCALVLETRF